MAIHISVAQFNTLEHYKGIGLDLRHSLVKGTIAYRLGIHENMFRRMLVASVVWHYEGACKYNEQLRCHERAYRLAKGTEIM